LNVRTLILAVLLSLSASGGLGWQADGRIHLSQSLGDRRATYKVQPKCPDDSCARCDGAKVVLKVVVRRSGTVKQVTVVRAGDARLAEAAIEAVRQWRYERHILNGTPAEYDTYTTVQSWVCEI
jgi:protein TonB